MAGPTVGGCARTPTGLPHPGLCSSCVSSRMYPQEGTALISEKAECVLAQPSVCCSMRKAHTFSEDVFALGEKFAFSLKFPG